MEEKRWLLMTCPVVLLVILFCAGCATSGIVAKPDLTSLHYDSQGVLKYEGKEVEGVKLKLPWYKEMWPDNPPEWGFALVTFGAGVGVGSAVSDSAGGGGDGDSDVALTTPTMTPAAGGGAGGGGDDGGDDGGGDDGGDDGGGDDGGGGVDETPW